ncbi:TIM-barrel domain-containing protein [Niallia sp. 03190]|uniref:TIM-barrel domain-containing protein n=1 Tax=Niallia sp. 03190 TaxID=3458061 RepID=UPI0040446797
MSIYKQRFKVISILAIAFVMFFSTAISSAFAATQPEADTPLNKNQLQKLSVNKVIKTADGAKFDLGEYTGYIHLLSKDMIKVSILPNGQQEKNSPAIAQTKWSAPSFITKEVNDQYILKTSEISVVVNKKLFGIKVLDKKGRVINEDYMKNGVSSGYEDGKPYVFKKTSSSENFYGFGEQAGLQLNKRGKSLGMWNTDAYGYDSNTKYVYTAVPFFIGLNNGKAYGILFDNTYRSYYEMASESDNYYYFYANGGPLSYYFMYGPDIQHVLDQYTQLTGKIDLPPEWTLGLHQSSWGYKATEEDSTDHSITSVARTYREKQIPLDTLHFDIDYMDGYRVFTFNDKFKQALQTLKGMGGFHSVVINDPGVKQDDNYSVYKEGTAKDYWFKQADGNIFHGPVWAGNSAFPNFLKKDVRNWWAESTGSTLLNAGFDGIWNDMNEPAVFIDGPGYNHTLPLDAYGEDDNNNKVTHEEFHNIFGHLENEATYDAWKKINSNERPFILTRDMFAGTQRYAAVWTGDSLSTWEHLQMSLPLNMNLGLSGAPFVGNDIGGFGGQATPELFARWIQVGAFLPYARIHYDGWSDSQYHQEPWSFGPEVEAISKKYIEMRYQLLPYIYNAFNDAAKTGKPVQQPLVYQYQKDAKTYNISDQYMFGDSLMLAPIVNPGQTTREVYLPEGNTWVNYWDKKEYKGGQTITVDAPLDYLPLFVKKNSIIPTRDVQQHTGEKPLTNLVLDTYLDNQASYSFYEDDGHSLNHKKGQYNLTNFNLKRNGKKIEFTKSSTVSKYKSTIKAYTLKINNAKEPSEVVESTRQYARVNTMDDMNKTNRSYYFDSSSQTLYVHIPTTASKVTINDANPLTANGVHNKSTSISGKTEGSSTVTATISGKSYKTKASSDGSFKINIPVQNTGKKISVYSQDKNGIKSLTQTITVARYAPNMPSVSKVKKTSTSVTGSAEKKAKITIKIGKKSYKGTVDSKGKFKVKIPKQKTGTKIYVFATDSENKTSVTKVVTVSN